MQDVAAVVGKDLFTDELRETLGQFAQAKNFGSLIVPKLRDPAEALRVVEARDFGGDLLLKDVQARVVAVLRMAEALSPKYHVVVANPPYMGGKGMNKQLAELAKSSFKNSKSDLFAMFIERGFGLIQPLGYSAMVTMQSWMFLSSYHKLRLALFEKSSIETMAHMDNMVMGIAFGTAATVWKLQGSNSKVGSFFFVRSDNINSAGRPDSFPPENERNSKLPRESPYFWRSIADFQNIAGSPITYWLGQGTFDFLRKSSLLGEVGDARMGLATGNNERYVRTWHEVSAYQCGFESKSREEARESQKRWFPYSKGGSFRKWYGNNEHVVDWKNDGAELQTTLHPDGHRIWAHNFNLDHIFEDSITWSDITSGFLSVRWNDAGHLFDGTGTCAFFQKESEKKLTIALLNTKFAKNFSKALNPTLHFQTGDFRNFPFKYLEGNRIEETVSIAVQQGRSDWDAYETSWDFTTLPLLQPDHRAETLEDTYTTLRTHWQGMTDEMQRLEEENNRIFIDAYGLADELTPEVPLNEITLTCNPAYRYGGNASDADRETRLRADTVAEFLSYAVGCMFGRYSLDAPGLILANQGETLANYLARIPEPQFMPDEDNVIPMLDADWFPDDITERFRLFLRATFGEDHFRENLRFIEAALGKDIRKYFTKDFYADHVKRYKKRPIYWQFASPKGTFNALIYMHRYRADTVSVILNDYLREFISKLQAERGRLEKLSDDPSASQGQRTKALKDVAVVVKQIDELNNWERDVVFPLAQTKIEIDLDDGVKANYPKFGAALKKIAGLEAKDD